MLTSGNMWDCVARAVAERRYGSANRHSSGRALQPLGVRFGRVPAGQSMVEFVLALPVLLILIMGTMEFGRFLAIYSMTNSASREAARFGAGVGDSGPGTGIHYLDCDGIRAAAARVSTALLAVGTVVIEYDNGPGTPVFAPVCPPPGAQVELGTRIIVRVTANYEPVVPFVPIGPIDITSETKRTILTGIDVTP